MTTPCAWLEGSQLDPLETPGGLDPAESTPRALGLGEIEPLERCLRLDLGESAHAEPANQPD